MHSFLFFTGWTTFDDPASGYPCFVSPEGETQWDHPGSGDGGAGIEMSHIENPMDRTKIVVLENPAHVRTGTMLPEGWGKDVDAEGNKYYYDETTGETAWIAPEGSTGGSAEDGGGLLNPEHARSDTILPANWGKDVDADGNKYYYHETDGTTAWVAPEGSSGGSSGL